MTKEIRAIVCPDRGGKGWNAIALDINCVVGGLRFEDTRDNFLDHLPVLLAHGDNEQCDEHSLKEDPRVVEAFHAAPKEEEREHRIVDQINDVDVDLLVIMRKSEQPL